MSDREEKTTIVKTASVADKRFAKRRSSKTPALIHHPTFQQPMSCIVRDSSSTGALIELAPTKGMTIHVLTRFPREFTLTILLERVAFECEVAWQKDMTLGVRYRAPARILAKPIRSKAKTEPPHGLMLSVLKKAGISVA
jgi:hypothetical protein